MVGGMAVLGITVLIQGAAAADIGTYDSADYTISSEADGDTYIAVGLWYGNKVTVGFEIKAPYGFVAGSTVITKAERSFTPHFHIDSNIASATLDANLSKRAMTYSVTSDPAAAVIGGYHMEFKSTAENPSYDSMISDIASRLDDSTLYPIPAYINGEERVRLGAYKTPEEAAAALEVYSAAFSDYEISVVSPSVTAVSVVNPETDKILFEFDSADASSAIGFMAYQGDEYSSYIQTPANKLYDGVMSFSPEYTDTYKGVSLINMLDLESYVEGCLPYEVSNSWSREVLRTFAITIRSYAIANYLKWFDEYGFDMTATTSDQVYSGRNQVNDAVVDAVSSTEGLVIVSNDKIVSAYYSSSTGGSTIGSEYAWSTQKDYLGTVDTPWERYADYNNGLWHAEISPEKLSEALRTNGGYTQITGKIVSIDIETVPDNPDYVYALTFTDENGNTVRVLKRRVITILSKFGVKSTNYTVGKGSLERTYDKVYDIEIIGGNKPITPSIDFENQEFLLRGYLTGDRLLMSNANVIIENGEVEHNIDPISYVLTSTGRKIIMSSSVATAEMTENCIPFDYDNHKVLKYKNADEDDTSGYIENKDTEDIEETEETEETEAVTDSAELEASTDTETDAVDTESEDTESEYTEESEDTESEDTESEDAEEFYDENNYNSFLEPEIIEPVSGTETASEALTEAYSETTAEAAPVTEAETYAETAAEEEIETAEEEEPVIPEGAYEVISEFPNVTVITTLETITETIAASSPESFIFAGKGWGHGVGISQYGAKDLSDAGASAEDIIFIYFKDVEIKHIDELYN